MLINSSKIGMTAKQRVLDGFFNVFFSLFRFLLSGLEKYFNFWYFIFDQISLITRLTARLVETLGWHASWMWMAVRLVIFVELLSPALFHILYKYLTMKNISKNVAYGKNSRNSLDVYKPDESFFESPQDKKPVLVLLSGGAWIIGYKGWNALLGLVLRKYGMVVVSPDYRNYPQGTVNDMILDVSTALQWTFENIDKYGGDPRNVFVLGQSAGGHLGMTAILKQAIKEAQGQKIGWSSFQLRSFIGVSSPYSLPELVSHMEERGLSYGILEEVFLNDMEAFSPYHILKSKEFSAESAKLLPPITLLHGSNDKTCPVSASLDMHKRLVSCGIQSFYIQYPEKTHTDPIIEDPLSGSNSLIFDIITVVQGEKAPRRTNTAIRRMSHEISSQHVPTFRLPKCVIRVARRINPF